MDFLLIKIQRTKHFLFR